MKKLKLALITAMAMCSSLAFSTVAFAGHHEEGEMLPATVVDIAVAAEATSTLVAAVKLQG